MRYELDNIERLVNEGMAAAASGRKNKADLNEVEKQIKDECSRIKNLFKHELISNSCESVQRYFSLHQRSLIAVLDTMHFETAKGEATIAGIRDSLTDLINSIKSNFPQFFDRDTDVPTYLAGRYQNELLKLSEDISMKFSPTDLDRELLNLILDLFRGNQHLPLSYRRLEHLQCVASHLLSVETSVNNEGLLRQDCFKVLIHCNCNTETFFKYYVRYVSGLEMKCETLSDKIDQAAYFLKVCSQEHCEKELAFDSGKAAINFQILEWLSQELEYLMQKQQLQITRGSREEGVNKDFKLNFDLSVSHLAYLFKAFIETGVIQNKNTSELIRFLTKFVKTKKSESVSFESFRIKFYNPETGTKDAVKKTLQSLLNYINKN